MQAFVAEEMIGRGAIFLIKCPAFAAHVVVDDRNRNDILQLLECAEDQCAVSPGAGVGNIEMVSACLGLESGLAGWSSLTFGGYPIAELRFRTDEAATAVLCIIPLVMPNAVDQ